MFSGAKISDYDSDVFSATKSVNSQTHGFSRPGREEWVMIGLKQLLLQAMGGSWAAGTKAYVY